MVRGSATSCARLFGVPLGRSSVMPSSGHCASGAAAAAAALMDRGALPYYAADAPLWTADPLTAVPERSEQPRPDPNLE